jgi:serine/threonine protein kinase
MLQKRGEGGVGVKEAGRRLLQLARIVAFAHEKKITHRDLKPGNVLVCQGKDGKLALKVVDFGIGPPQLQARRPQRQHRFPGRLRGCRQDSLTSLASRGQDRVVHGRRGRAGSRVQAVLPRRPGAGQTQGARAGW